MQNVHNVLCNCCRETSLLLFGFSRPQLHNDVRHARLLPGCCAAVKQPSSSLRIKQRLDCTALVHRTVSLCHLIERQSQIEDLAWVNLPVPHQVDQLGQITAHKAQVHHGGARGSRTASRHSVRRHAGRRRSSHSHLCEWN